MTEEDSKNEKKPEVWILDDEVLVSRAMDRTLRGFCEVRTYSHPDDVGDMLTGGEKPDLLITDYAMPSTNGLQMVTRIRSGGWTFPIIMVSSSNVEAEARSAGVDEYLDKPFDPSKLKERVREALKKKT